MSSSLSIAGSAESPRQTRIILACIAVAILDGFDVQALSFVLPVISPLWGIDKATAGHMLTSGVIGLMVGTILLGPLGDRYGRQIVLMYSLAAFSLLTIATITAASPLQLMGWRLVTGIGLGAALVNAVALVAEAAPQRGRATVITLMYAGFPLGGSMAGFAAPLILSAGGWQLLFAIAGVLPLVLLPVLRRWLPRTPPCRSVTTATLPGSGTGKSRTATGTGAIADAAGSFALLFGEGRAAATLMLWALCFLTLLQVYLLIMWLPSLLSDAGLPTSFAIRAGAIFNLGGVVGGIAMAVLVDRLGPRFVLMAAYTAAALSIVGLADAHSKNLVLVWLLLSGIAVIGAQFCITALLATYYPSDMRATGIGWGLGVGRIGAVIAPVLAGSAQSAGWGGSDILRGVAFASAVCAILMLFYRTDKVVRQEAP